LVFSGLHLSRKGLPFALQALSQLPASASWTLDVLGEGIMSAPWRQTAHGLGLKDRVTFHGYVSREKVFEIMDRGEVYVFPSLLEGWPTVIAESLSLGMPVVTTDLHGMRDMVTPSCGRLVPADSPASIVSGLRRALSELLDNPDLLTRLSEGAIERANELTAAKQMPKVMRAYDEAVRVAAL
jgi:glycosyltransferase involved in cell wall biosynthesis